MKKKIILIGSGGHAASCIDVIEATKKYIICGLVSDDKKPGTKFLNYPILVDLNNVEKVFKITKNLVLAFGSIYDCKKRSKIFNKLKEKGFVFQSVVSPNSYVSKKSKIGPGTIVMHGSIINSGVEIGENCIINSNSLIEHDCILSSNCHVSTSATLNGGVIVGKDSFIGSRSVIKEGCILKSNSFVKMGQVVKSNL